MNNTIEEHSTHHNEVMTALDQGKIKVYWNSRNRQVLIENHVTEVQVEAAFKDWWNILAVTYDKVTSSEKRQARYKIVIPSSTKGNYIAIIFTLNLDQTGRFNGEVRPVTVHPLPDEGFKKMLLTARHQLLLRIVPEYI